MTDFVTALWFDLGLILGGLICAGLIWAAYAIAWRYRR
jgi:hypothetical protein